MSIEHNQSLLASIVCDNNNINNAAATVNQLTEACKAGQISKEEYTELLKDVQRQVNIESNMSELRALEVLNTAINGLIRIASLV